LCINLILNLKNEKHRVNLKNKNQAKARRRKMENTDRLAINTIRFLAVDMVEKAGSGHPGLPLGAAAPAYILWRRIMKVNPADPGWSNRDRFILSPGHGSALLYALLYTHGYALTLDDLKAFRQLGSLTPGHPEMEITPGVDASTGPLGHGLAMGVGMALAQRFQAGRFNKPGFPVVDHYVYALVSDGDLMEGVAAEAVSLAGTLKLGRLIYLYDSNNISIEGSTDLSFTEDVAGHFIACGWQVLKVEDSEDLTALETALHQARANLSQPSLLIVKSHIGRGSPKQDSPSAHGEPLGSQAMAATRAHYNWPDQPFYLPPEITCWINSSLAKGQAAQKAWQDMFDGYAESYPQLARQYQDELAGVLPEEAFAGMPEFSRPMATRSASGQVINALAANLPNLLGGSADLGPSNKTVIENGGDMNQEGPGCGRNIHFGVREHAMGAVINGMALYGGLLPYGATFFSFADFLRPALRMAALMKIKSIFVFTHDSLAVGEDGPTHQPVEQLMSLRLIPGLTVLRPADAWETLAAWQTALRQPGPCVLVLSRQDLPLLPGRRPALEYGAYVLSPEEAPLTGIIATSGSEAHLALAVKEKLKDKGRGFRVVSMPCWEIFAAQTEEYRNLTIPPWRVGDGLWRVSIEAGVSMGWERWLGPRGGRTLFFGINRFGLSGPGGQVMDHFGFNAEKIAKRLLTGL
jgi:transketolase